MRLLPLALSCAVLAAASADARDLTSATLKNKTAYIPSQCYTKTEDESGAVHNPCMTCHVSSRAPNYTNDDDLQLEYAFPGPALKNPWTNLFVDRSEAISKVSDAEIDAWVNQSNYFDADGTITLARVLADVPAAWDDDGNGKWDGYIPDLHYSFDDQGFDHAADGSLTGWRAFAYVPLPGAFWPTNGSTDDVLIRLAPAFRQTADGKADLATYIVNLAITEAIINRADVAIDPVDEAAFGVDLDKDGKIGTADHIAYDWAPMDGRMMSWVGAAEEASTQPPTAGLFPLGTEFIHTVRYVGVTPQGGIALAPRVKEVRYGIKNRWQSYADLEEGAMEEIKEGDDFPDRIEAFFGDAETGIGNGAGWRYQAFIEDVQGALRPQNFEETVFCMGCHGGVGVTDDSAFAFPRKLPSASAQARGWYHWSQKGLAGTPDRLRADGRQEILTYLQQNHAADEFRNNAEAIERAFDPDGRVKPDYAARLKEDVSVALFPSPERARKLNAAYREIVFEQSYVKGRDTVVSPAANVHKQVEQDQSTGVQDAQSASGW